MDLIELRESNSAVTGSVISPAARTATEQRNAVASLKESFQRLGLSEQGAAAAVDGRTAILLTATTMITTAAKLITDAIGDEGPGESDPAKPAGAKTAKDAGESGGTPVAESQRRLAEAFQRFGLTEAAACVAAGSR